MKKALLVLGVLVLFAISASAQMPSKPFSLYAGGGMTMPMSPDAFKDMQKTGYHGMVGIGFNAMPALQVIGKIEYHAMAADNSIYSLMLSTAENDIKGGTFTPLMFGADARYAFSLPAAPIAPFVIAGAGMARLSYSDVEWTGGTMSFDSESKMYWNVGGGFEFKAGPAASLFVEARYVSIATDGEATSMLPISLGIKF